jgi:hypothetical protein
MIRPFSAVAITWWTLSGISACSPHTVPEPVEDLRLYDTKLRKLPPPPTYSKTRWVRPPEILPERDLPGRERKEVRRAPSVRPIYSLSLEKVSLTEAARVLAATARYSSYTASSISKEKITIQSIGTIDELADQIAAIAGIHVVVDHEHKEVRFLEVHVQAPRFYSE